MKNITSSVFSYIKDSLNKSDVTSTQKKQDGWQNSLTGIGAYNSRTASTKFAESDYKLKNKEYLTSLYTNDGLSRKIVNIIVDDALRAFINCDKNLLNELHRLQVKQKVLDVATWARLYGGAVIVAFIDDNSTLDQPLNTKNIKQLINLKVYDRYQVSFDAADVSTDIYDVNYGEPILYKIKQYNNDQEFLVHRSRLHIMRGERTPEQKRNLNQGWDDSVLRATYEAVKNYGATMSVSAEIIQDFVQGVLAVDGLTSMLASKSGEQQITNRAIAMDMTKSVAKTLMIDSESESYTKLSTPIGGLADLWDKFAESVSATTGIPLTRLLGRSATGLNNNGSGEIENWNLIVDAYRTDEIKPAIDFIINILENQLIWQSNEIPENFDWTFPSLKVVNETEQIKNRLMTAQIDQIYLDRNAVNSEFLYKKRYENGNYNVDINITEEEFAEQDKEREINLTEEQISEVSKLYTETTKVNEIPKKSQALDDAQTLLIKKITDNIK